MTTVYCVVKVTSNGFPEYQIVEAADSRKGFKKYGNYFSEDLAAANALIKKMREHYHHCTYEVLSIELED